MDLPVPVNARKIGECIYCGVRDVPLGKEHAVPYGLNGPWTLLEASCEACAKITHRFERDTMKSLWPEIRIALALQSRRRGKRPTTLPLVVQRGGTKEKAQIPLSEYPVYLPTPLFPPPAILWNPKPVKGVFANLDAIHIAGPTFKQLSQQYPDATFIGVHTNFAPVEFARTLAKIGFCAGVCALGLRPFTHTPIRKIILGDDPCIGHWVGSWWGESINAPYGGHAIKVLPREQGTDIHVIIRLFAQFGAPEYHVVLGEADPAFIASGDWPPSWRIPIIHGQSSTNSP
jgi:hypothetical protein